MYMSMREDEALRVYKNPTTIKSELSLEDTQVVKIASLIKRYQEHIKAQKEIERIAKEQGNPIPKAKRKKAELDPLHPQIAAILTHGQLALWERKRNSVYRDIIYPSFKKLAESLIFKYGQKQNDHDNYMRDCCIAHLTDKIDKYDENRKAFQFFNMVAKHYIIQECILKPKRNVPIVSAYAKRSANGSEPDENAIGFGTVVVDDRFVDDSYKTVGEDPVEDFFKYIIRRLAKLIVKTEDKHEKIFLNQVILILENRKKNVDIMNKRELYYIMRVLTNFKAREITRLMSKLKKHFEIMRKDWVEKY